MNSLPAFPGTSIGRQLREVARCIRLDSTPLPEGIASELGAYLAEQTGYDTHNNLVAEKLLFVDLDEAARAFAAELKAQGQEVWERTTVVTMTDFARTITSNGLGSDHAWGGPSVIFGGKVSGGKFHGHYPARLVADHSKEFIVRGRAIPELPWEAPWYGVCQNLGLTEGQIEQVLPHINNFPPSKRLDASVLFKG